MFSMLIVGAIAPKLLFPGIRIFFILFSTGFDSILYEQLHIYLQLLKHTNKRANIELNL